MHSQLPSVLLVEDNEDTRKMLELLFEEWGYRATLVGTATEGLKQLLEHRFDLIILDNWLPDLEGIELCRQIRAADRQTPIVFYSSAGMGSEDRAALSVGANAFIAKSSGLAVFREAMAEALRKAGNHSPQSF